MRILLLGLWLLPAALPVVAQPVPPARPATAAPPDTAAALHRLFASRRQRCDLLVGGTLVAAVSTAVLVAASEPAPAGGGSGYGSLSGGALVGGSALRAFGVGVFTVPVVLT